MIIFFPSLFWLIFILASDILIDYFFIAQKNFSFYQKFLDLAFTLSWYLMYKIQILSLLFRIILKMLFDYTTCEFVRKLLSNYLSCVNNLIFSLMIIPSFLMYNSCCILFPCFLHFQYKVFWDVFVKVYSSKLLEWTFNLKTQGLKHRGYCF